MMALLTRTSLACEWEPVASVVIAPALISVCMPIFRSATPCAPPSPEIEAPETLKLVPLTVTVPEPVLVIGPAVNELLAGLEPEPPPPLPPPHPVIRTAAKIRCAQWRKRLMLGMGSLLQGIGENGSA